MSTLSLKKCKDSLKRQYNISPGNLGIALSIVYKLKGYKFICVIDPNTSPLSKKNNRRYME